MDTSGIKSALSSITVDALLSALLLVVAASLLIFLIQKLVPVIADRLSGKPRLYLLASVPLLRLLIIVLTIILVVPMLVEPSFENMVAVFGALGLALGFAFKDYATSLVAGIVTLYEMPYRPGDWIEVNGHYGEVRSIGTRTVDMVTLDDSVVVIPHGVLWNSLMANGNDGTDNLMCVAEVFIDPNHDVDRMLNLFRNAIFTSPLTRTYQPVRVTVSAQKAGMQYRLKAYPIEPREQVSFVSDLTARAVAICREEGVPLIALPWQNS